MASAVGRIRLCWVTGMLAVSGAARAEKPVSRAVFVEDGKLIEVRQEGKGWLTRDGLLTCGGTGPVLIAPRELGGGAFHIRAKLTIRNLAKSAASFQIGGGHFGFEGRHGRPFVEGPPFRPAGDKGYVRPGKALVAEGKAFLLEVIRRGGELAFQIDGAVVYRTKVPTGRLGTFGFRPWRSTMEIADFSAEGDLRPLPKPVPETVLFTSGEGGHHSYRIPAIIVTGKSTVLAFCEGRKNSRSDTGDINLVMRRSTDGGKTWSPLRIIWDDAGNVCGNPCPVVDQSTGTIWLLLTWNLGSDGEGGIKAGRSKDTRRVYVSHSDDDGVTWSKHVDITATTKKPQWRWYATGPGVGIQLQRGKHKGRLLIPCDTSIHDDGKHPYRSHVIYSDDHGKTWRLGGVADEKTNECQAVELVDGRIYLNMRSYHGKHCRAVSTSSDGGATWSAVAMEPAQPGPVCQASVLRYSAVDAGDSQNILLYSGPGGRGRDHMTIRMSRNEGRTWPVARVLCEGGSAYSCLTVLPGGDIGCLYEKDGYRTIVLARFPLEWVTAKPSR